jgi:hypothetical protein
MEAVPTIPINLKKSVQAVEAMLTVLTMVVYPVKSVVSVGEKKPPPPQNHLLAVRKLVGALEKRQEGHPKMPVWIIVTSRIAIMPPASVIIMTSVNHQNVVVYVGGRCQQLRQPQPPLQVNVLRPVGNKEEVIARVIVNLW